MKQLLLLLLFLLYSLSDTCGQEIVNVLNEQFDSNSNNWLIDADQTKKLELKNGKYIVQNKQQYNAITTSLLLPFEENGGFIIECQAEKLTGSNDKGYGLVWGKNKSDYYSFYITGDGFYAVIKWEKGKRHYIIDDTESENINIDNAINTFKVEKRGDNLYYYVNNKLLEQTDHFEFFGDEIGFYNEGKSSIAIDFLNISQSISSRETPSSSRKSVILYDDFSDNSNDWQKGTLKGGYSNIENDSYKIENKNKKPIYCSTSVDINPDDDFIIETEVQSIDGEKEDSYCLMWGSNESNTEYYAFRINAFYGYYEYYRIKNNSIDKLIDVSYSTVVNTEPNSTNKIKIRRSGDLFDFYINGNHVNDYKFQEFFGNQLGFIVHFEHSISVKYIEVKYPMPSF